MNCGRSSTCLTLALIAGLFFMLMMLFLSHSNSLSENKSAVKSNSSEHNFTNGSFAHFLHELAENHNKSCYIYGEIGWKCDQETCQKKSDCCILLEWVCDGSYQCIHDDSDEELGCMLRNRHPDLFINKTTIGD